ncbi:hypothetical protein ACFOEZ_18045 [Tianweitania populi]|uniref:hypothetical protein n=1 Tax=Tianweitania populi TaxID=1607949 RepID=UPI001674CF64|nr:hypothetical protein [Tianweitania populi]
MRIRWWQSLKSLANSTIALSLVVSALIASAAVSAVWLIAFEKEGSWLALPILFFSGSMLYGLFASAYSRGQADKWMALYPGPISFSAPLWHRLLLCLAVMLLAGLLFYSVGVRGEPGRLDDWDPLNLMIGGILSLPVTAGALCTLPRRELVLRREGFEYLKLTGRCSYRWESISDFRLTSQGNILVCTFAHQPKHRWFGRRGLMIAGQVGILKTSLRSLMTAWQERALADPQRSTIGRHSQGTAKSSPRRSLLDYA